LFEEVDDGYDALRERTLFAFFGWIEEEEDDEEYSDEGEEAIETVSPPDGYLGSAITREC
jgi:hypothetical protein